MDNKTVYYSPLPPKPATLLILEKGRDINLVPLYGYALLGRESVDSNADIRLLSGIVSRNHGEFVFDETEGFYYYKDNNSLNGTFFNGVKLERVNERGSKSVKLTDGDVIGIDCDNPNNPRSDSVIIIFSTSIRMNEKWKRLSLANRSSVRIGRNSADDIELLDFMVSREHAILTKSDIGWTISDCGSSSGIAVNKNAIEKERILSVFDIIKLGNTTLIFLGDEIIYNEVVCSSQMLDMSENSVMMSVNISEVSIGKSGSFAQRMVLSDINLDVYKGDFILILGDMGTGKTTFAKALMGNLGKNGVINGKVVFDNMDLYRNYNILRHKIGTVPSFSTTRDGNTVYNTLMDAAHIKLSGEYTSSEIKQRVDDVMSKFMLIHLSNNLIKNLSVGQKKRVDVAIQAIGDQQVFILDDPDLGMKRDERVDLMSNLKFCTDTGDVVMVISHSPDEVATLFTKVIVLAKCKRDDITRLAFYGDVENALAFFGVEKLTDIVSEINVDTGKGRADEFVSKFEKTRRG